MASVLAASILKAANLLFDIKVLKMEETQQESTKLDETALRQMGSSNEEKKEEPAQKPSIAMQKDRAVELPQIEDITGLRPGSKGRNFESFIGHNKGGARVLIKLYK